MSFASDVIGLSDVLYSVWKETFLGVREFVRVITPRVVTKAYQALMSEPANPLRRNKIDLGGPTIKCHPDAYQSLSIFCGSEPASTEEMANFLERSQGCQRLLDIGSFYGAFALAFTNHAPDRKALAIDASALAFALLLYNAHANKHLDIVPIETAMSDTSGELAMHYEWLHAVAAPRGEVDITVEKQSGDELCEKYSFAPDVVKIDVEGHELKVIRGMRSVFKEHRPLLFLEIHPAWIQREGQSVSELEALLHELGYACESHAELDAEHVTRTIWSHS